MQSENTENMYLVGSLPKLFAKTATPIISIMAVSGLFTVVDAYFLGRYVGADALTAVTLMFPIYMILVALATLVSNGFSSVYARLLGAKEHAHANSTLVNAIQLALIVCMVLIAFMYFLGSALILKITNGNTQLADMGYTYISILLYCSPLMFVLSIQIDALRCEGKLAAMAILTLMAALLNILFDYIFIAKLDMGVAGSAWGTILAQICNLVAIIYYRVKAKASIGILGIHKISSLKSWKDLLALGAPTSLSYLGISLSATLILYNLQVWSADNYEIIAGAYGILTRLMTFTFLPLLGISIAFQTILGNNYGAKSWLRSNKTLKIALGVAIIYCIVIEGIYLYTRNEIGYLFIDDPRIVSELARIIPYSVVLMFIFGPLLMISGYFQAIGDAKRAAILSLSRTYIFSLPLIFILPFWYGELGIWTAGIVSEICVLALTLFVLFRRSKQNKVAGLFEPISQ